MVNCESTQLLMVDSLYDSLPQTRQTELELHLSTCAECARLYEELGRSVALLPKQLADTPRKHGDELENLWNTLEPVLDRIDAQRFHALANPRRRIRQRAMLAVAASLVLMVGGVVIVDNTPDETPAVVQEQPVRPVRQATEVDSFLTRVRPALLTLANATVEDIGAMPLDRGQAQAMALEASTLGGTGRNRLTTSQQNLLREVQYLLLQYSNLEEGDMTSGLEVLQLFLDENQVLFKMQLNELQEPDTVI